MAKVLTNGGELIHSNKHLYPLEATVDSEERVNNDQVNREVTGDATMQPNNESKGSTMEEITESESHHSDQLDLESNLEVERPQRTAARGANSG